MDESNDKLFGIFSYLSILVLVPVIAGKTEFVKFHANQGLVLFIMEAIVGTIIGVLSRIYIVGIIFGIIGVLFELACLVLSLMGIVNVANYDEKELPIIGSIHILK